jgi:hypothetical protein
MHWHYNSVNYPRMIHMNKIQLTLQNLEDRLQSLVEGSTQRFFPVKDFQRELSHALMIAMQSEIHYDEKGHLVAPDLFTIFLPEEHAQVFQNNPHLIDELSDDLVQVSLENQVSFNNELRIKVVPNPEPEATEIQIVTQYTLIVEEETSILTPFPITAPGNPAAGAFLIVDGTQVFPLEGKAVTIGHQEDNELVIAEASVSPKHAQLRVVRGCYHVFDLGSSGGTFVNGTRISRARLSPGDIISLCDIPIVFGMESSADLDQTQELDLST